MKFDIKITGCLAYFEKIMQIEAASFEEAKEKANNIFKEYFDRCDTPEDFPLIFTIKK